MTTPKHHDAFPGLPGDAEDQRNAFRRGGYVWEGLSDAGHGIGKVIIWLMIIVVAAFIARWAFTEYWIATHCTMVLGTRVCQ
jgi:hypothetical protein